MKLRITIIDWEYPDDDEELKPQIWEMLNKKALMDLYLAFANGIIVEMKVEGDSEDAVRLIKGIASGAGSCIPYELSTIEKESLWLTQDGYECYKQGRENSGYIFINPFPQPQYFD